MFQLPYLPLSKALLWFYVLMCSVCHKPSIITLFICLFVAGEITFEEYSAHLEQQVEIKEEQIDVPSIETEMEITTERRESQPGTSAGGGGYRNCATL